MTADKRSQLDMRFQEALQYLTGVRPPADFQYSPSPADSDVQHTWQQEWAVDAVRPTWACGISLVDAARAFVLEAVGNGNIHPDGTLKHPPTVKVKKGRVQVDVSVLEYDVGGRCIWIHNARGETVLRIQCTSVLESNACTNVCVHADIRVNGEVEFCVPVNEGNYG